LKQDAVLVQMVREWEGHLLPMAEFAKSAMPSPQVWAAVEKRLGLLKAEDRWTFWRQLREDLSFWRGLGMVSTTAAVILVSILMTRPADIAPPASLNYVATLSDEASQAVVLISGDKRKGKMTVRMVKAQAIAANQSLELWSIAKDGKVKSLGLIVANGSAELPLPDYLSPEATNILAISLEPKGGSGNPEKPSGPILFKGVWLQV
jgi:anti-sigma-K factor RskA